MINKREVGNEYESIACSYLISKGCEILERNYRNRYGEIDIILKDKDEIVFVEVKYRKNDKYGDGLEAIGHNKLRKIALLANYYIMEKNLYDKDLRIDCISIIGNRISWIKGV